MKSNLGVNALLSGIQAPPELYLFITPSIRAILGMQNTSRKFSIKVSK